MYKLRYTLRLEQKAVRCDGTQVRKRMKTRAFSTTVITLTDTDSNKRQFSTRSELN